MLPSYSCTEYTSPSGATHIYVVQRRKALHKISERRKYLIQQKLLGLMLIFGGIVGCMIFREDCTGFAFAVFMGIARVISNK